jgi:hypothetical protein
MARKRREAIELREASEHLFYEFWMFSTLARALTTNVFGKDNVANNAILESFLIHARNLLDFLFADSREPRIDDVVAEDFLEVSEQWPAARGKMDPVLETLNRRVGKEVAHLTYARLNVEADAKPWHFLDLALEVEILRDRFLGIVPAENLSSAYWKGRGPFGEDEHAAEAGRREDL